MRRLALLLPAVLLLAALAGCEDKSVRVDFQQQERAQVEIGQVRRIALLDLDSYSREVSLAREATDRLIDLLREQRYLQVLDRSTLEMTLHQNNLPVLKKPDIETIKRYGSVLAVDAVLCGWVDARVDTERRYRTVYRYVGTGEYEDYQERESVLFGPVVTKRREKTRQIEATETYIRKEGVFTIEMTAYETRKGEVLGKSTARRSFGEDYHDSYYPSDSYFSSYSSRIPSDSEILVALMSQCLGRMVRAFSPHFTPRSRRMDKGQSGEGAVRDGIRKAQGGDWNGAIAIWGPYVQKNSSSYAGHKNLGIGYEVTMKYQEALTHYRQALALKPKAGDVKDAISQVERVFLPAQVPFDAAKIFHIVEKRDDGALYIDAGEKDGIKLDDTFELLTEKEIKNTVGEVIGKDLVPVGTLRVTKVFEKMSLTVISSADRPGEIRIGDFVRRR